MSNDSNPQRRPVSGPDSHEPPNHSMVGFDPLWFAMMIIVNLQMPLLTPAFVAIGMIPLLIFLRIVTRLPNTM